MKNAGGGARAIVRQAQRGARDPALARSLNADLQTFAVWLERNKSRIPLD